LSSSERARYQRHLALAEIGVPGQEKLKAARVLVVGAGGLGSPAALYLAAAGCGTLGLLDCDRVELSNLQRQVLFDSGVIAKPKAEAGRERLASLNPEIRIVAHALELKAANVRAVFENYDLVIDGTDRLSTRYLINDACVLLGLPLVSAAIHRFEGQVMTYVPGRGPCYRCVFPQAVDGPRGWVPARIGEIGPGRAPVFICRSGGRSLAACEFALRAGIASPANLDGGLQAWAREVDPELTVA